VEEGSAELPEIIRLRDARGERPQNTAGIGEFWYEPEIWSLPLPPAAKVLYAGLCSFLGHAEINHRDLRNTLRDRTDQEIVEALENLVHRGPRITNIRAMRFVRSGPSSRPGERRLPGPARLRRVPATLE
jgi:hypothetical protein